MWLLSELKRRNVPRMAVLYAVTAWLIVQVVVTVTDIAKLPAWIGTTTLWLLAIGFPIALILSWFYQMTAGGIALEQDVDLDESMTPVTGSRLNIVVVSMLCAAVILFAYDKWWTATPAQQSIAVLPFVNMSDDPSNIFFSDGISEELLNLLTRIPELRVTSRSSAFSYRDKDIDLPTIAEQLNVAHILEGSVRKAGNQVRITVQLIETRTDTHLWSETYDRTLEDIFATQDEIAAEVVEHLKVAFLGDVPTLQATDPEAYSLVLQGRYLIQQVTPDAIEKSISLFEHALTIAPGYAAAWAGLASGYFTQADLALRPFDEGYRLAREAANQGLVIDPGRAPAHLMLASISLNYDRDLAAAARHYEKALALEPANVDSISGAASMAAALGRLDQAIVLAEYAAARDPVSPFRIANLGAFYLYAGRADEAIASLRQTLTLSPDYLGAQYGIGEALLLKGESESALAAMLKAASEVYRLIGLVMAYHALGEADASDSALGDLIEKYNQDAAYNIAYVLAFRGEADRAFKWLNKAVSYRDPGLTEIGTQALFTNIRLDGRWLPFLESIGQSPEQLASIDFKVTLPK